MQTFSQKSDIFSKKWHADLSQWKSPSIDRNTVIKLLIDLNTITNSKWRIKSTKKQKTLWSQVISKFKYNFSYYVLFDLKWHNNVCP
jgi:hypothetical protein